MYGYLLRRVRRRVLFALKNSSYQFLLFLAARGFRLNIFWSIKACRQAEILFRSIPAMDEAHMESLMTLVKRLRSMKKLRIIEVTGANVKDYLSCLLEVERAAYPKGFQIDAESLLARFDSRNHKPPICYLYFKNGSPVAYTLGTYLEFYPPWEYGFEISAHPGFLRFSTFYYENICVLPSEQNEGVGMQSVIETLFAAQKRGYKCIVLHARTKSGASSLGKRLGFSQVKLIEGFLQSEELVALMTCCFPCSHSNTNHV